MDWYCGNYCICSDDFRRSWIRRAQGSVAIWVERCKLSLLVRTHPNSSLDHLHDRDTLECSVHRPVGTAFWSMDWSCWSRPCISKCISEIFPDSWIALCHRYSQERSLVCWKTTPTKRLAMVELLLSLYSCILQSLVLRGLLSHGCTRLRWVSNFLGFMRFSDIPHCIDISSWSPCQRQCLGCRWMEHRKRMAHTAESHHVQQDSRKVSASRVTSMLHSSYMLISSTTSTLHIFGAINFLTIPLVWAFYPETGTLRSLWILR